MGKLSVKHLIGIKNLNPEDINLILDTAQTFKEVINRPIKKVPSMRDVTVVNLFLKTLHVHVCHSSWQRKGSLPMCSILLHHHRQSAKAKH